MTHASHLQCEFWHGPHRPWEIIRAIGVELGGACFVLGMVFMVWGMGFWPHS